MKNIEVSVNEKLNTEKGKESAAKRIFTSAASLFRKSLSLILRYSLYIVLVGVLGLILSYIFDWTDHNFVTFIFVFMIIIGVVLQVIMLKRESRY